MDYDFSECVVLNARMAARSVSRRYEKWMRGYGITAAQFSILAGLSRVGELSVTEIADKLAMDRTTASRNLDLLERKGLVVSRGAERGNRRLCALTDQGRDLLEELVPRWQAAQDAMKQELGQDAFAETIKTLRHISALP